MKYTITEGSHNPFHLPMVHSGIKEMQRWVKLDRNCHHWKIPCNINRIFGFSFGNPNKNSLRFSWDSTEDSNKFSLYSTTVMQGLRMNMPLIELDYDIFYHLEILSMPHGNSRFGDIHYKVRDASGVLLMNYENSYLFPKDSIGFILQPYFGKDNIVAPHDMEIYLNK